MRVTLHPGRAKKQCNDQSISLSRGPYHLLSPPHYRGLKETIMTITLPSAAENVAPVFNIAEWHLCNLDKVQAKGYKNTRVYERWVNGEHQACITSRRSPSFKDS